MTNSEISSDPGVFDKEQTATAVAALLAYNEKKKSGSLFMDQSMKFMLDITTFKTPSGKNHFYNICLPFSPHNIESSDVVLIVKDGKDQDPDHVVGKLKDELMAGGADGDVKLREIMTLKQFKDEFSTHEAKRALAKRVDIIITEDSIFKCLPTVLGREFYKKKKLPISIKGRKWRKMNMQAQIAQALTKTVMNISTNGQTSTVVVGHDNLSCEQLTENISKVSGWIKRKYPGGWQNIAKLALHTGNCPPLVIYFSTASRNIVEKPPTTRNKNLGEPIQEEVSTTLGKRVKVFPDGNIEVEDEDISDEDDAAIIKSLISQPRKKKFNNKKTKKNAKKFKKEEPAGVDSD